MSSLPSDQLPHSMKANNGVSLVCKVQAQLGRSDMRRKNHKWYNLKREYHLAEFDVKMLVGAGLQFEIWGQDEWGTKAVRSKAHEEIRVAWEAPDDRSLAKQSEKGTAEIFPV